jgi:VWFA-related protein
LRASTRISTQPPQSPHHRAKPALFVFALGLGVCISLFLSTAIAKAQAGAAQPAQAPASQAAADKGSDKGSEEMTSRDQVATFKVNVRLVLVRVVVRDGKGHAVGNLQKQDFQLFDNRKPQVITHFAVEQPGAQVKREQKTSQENPGGEPAEAGKLPSVPERYIAYLFDDVHLEFGDLAQVRDAASRHMASLQPTDRAAIFSTSGQGNLDFTDDRAKLHETLLGLRPRPYARVDVAECPDVTYFMADLIENKRDDQAYQVAFQDALACLPPRTPAQVVDALVHAAARQRLITGETEARLALGTLKDVVRRISAMPGQRTVVLVSPGFLLTGEHHFDEADIIERSVHSNVIVSALDARGLYVVVAGGDASQHSSANTQVVGPKGLYQMASASAEADVMAELADGTGGTFFHNSNDLDEGFRRVAATPEYYYVLGFSPQNLKLDGHFHSLKVTLKKPEKLNLQARRGYYAPKHIPDPAEEAKQEIEDALFSQEEMHDLPVQLHTQFFKSGEQDAKLAVLVHVDVKQMHFQKAEGRNRNDLTVVSGLFDRNGNYITGMEKIVQMRLRDETLERRLGSGITLKTSFDVKPGSYLVRLVVRDAEGQLSAENGAIEIP